MVYGSVTDIICKSSGVPGVGSSGRWQYETLQGSCCSIVWQYDWYLVWWHMGEYGVAVRVGWQYDMAVRIMVEGYPPDESLEWDKTIHITSL